MVHFGRYILANRVPEWERHYIGYKSLKKRINAYARQASNASTEEREAIMNSFSRLLDLQVEKIVLFLIEEQGVLASRLQQLSEKQETALVNSMQDAQADTRLQLMEEYRAVAKDLLRLLNFVEINTTGLRKILKKFDKRVGFRFREQYLASRINHPYSQLQQVFRQVGIGALVGTIAQNLAQLGAGRTRSFVSLFGVSSYLPPSILEQEPIVEDLECALRKLTKEASFTRFVANDLLLPEPSEQALEGVDERELHFMSVQLNLWNTFLYMVNYYIVVPTSDDYAERLHVPGTMNGVIIGAMPLAALLSAFLYSWWSNFSYRAPLVVSTLLLIAGNIMYGLALSFNSVWFMLIGRALNGLGGARAINRRYLMDHVPVKHLTLVSAWFVIASSLGMAAGPAFASVLIKLDFEVFGIAVNEFTAPGWSMMLLWSLYLVFCSLFFKEPVRKPLEGDLEQASEPETKHPLLQDHSNRELDDDDDAEDVAAMNNRGLLHVLKSLSPAVKILLTVYFMLKFASEMLVSESGIVSEYYFNWSSSQVGLFLGALGLAVLPICAVVANYVSNMFADRAVIFWTEVLVAFGVVANICYRPYVNYTPVQYVGSAIIIFLAVNVLEGVNMSLLSKVMPSKLSRGVFNCGFLSTEAGTLARALSDGLITLGGRAGMEYLLLVTMLPTLLLVLVTIAITWLGYYTLY